MEDEIFSPRSEAAISLIPSNLKINATLEVDPVERKNIVKGKWTCTTLENNYGTIYFTKNSAGGLNGKYKGTLTSYLMYDGYSKELHIAENLILNFDNKQIDGNGFNKQWGNSELTGIFNQDKSNRNLYHIKLKKKYINK